eukprot:c31646_g1_i1 orf=57-227(-)
MVFWYQLKNLPKKIFVADDAIVFSLVRSFSARKSSLTARRITWIYAQQLTEIDSQN